MLQVPMTTKSSLRPFPPIYARYLLTLMCQHRPMQAFSARHLPLPPLQRAYSNQPKMAHSTSSSIYGSRGTLCSCHTFPTPPHIYP
ncbi:hypothetical protein B0T12DRAFT_168502 [Alternaria alternata]|nr:hypothetical protein B0T12DRAFT_168502 [Alternaria alternata]